MNYIKTIILLMLAELALATFDTEFLEKEDSCTTSKITTSIAEDVIMVSKNLVIPEPRRDTKFLLYTRDNPVKSQNLYIGDKNSIYASNFNPRNPVRILIHGFQNTHRDCLSVLVRNAYLRKGEFNVIVVDWSIMAARICYLSAIAYLDDVADVINEFTTFLNYEFGVPFDNMYLIGHSLGAHVAGFTGRRLKIGRYNTIFGLDPAGPIFKGFKDDDAIKETDATYVETIHTDMSVLGYNGHLGLASIYPNYGRTQKRCAQGILSILDYSCNHASAYIYFANSINKPGIYMARRCDSFDNITQKQCKCDRRMNINCDKAVPMGGEPSIKKSPGDYYLIIEKDKNESDSSFNILGQNSSLNIFGQNSSLNIFGQNSSLNIFG